MLDDTSQQEPEGPEFEEERKIKLWSRFASLLRVGKLQSPDEWASKNRVYGPSTGVPGRRNPMLSPSLVSLGRAVVCGLYTRVVGVTSAQMGKTDTVLDVTGQRLDQRPTPIIYVGPSRDFITDQFEPRVKAMINECETLSDKLIRGRREKKTRKVISGVTLRLASGGSSAALKSDPAGLGIVDEYDEMSRSIRGQGDPLGLVEARGETYSDYVTLVTSTPGKGVCETEKDPVNGLEFFAVADPREVESQIWRLFQEGTRHHWATPCPQCGDVFIAMRKHLKWPPGSTGAQANRDAYVECPNGCVIEDDRADHSDYLDSTPGKMNTAGFMIAPGQTIEDARAGINAPENSTYSQWSSGLWSPFVSWGARAERMVKAEMSGEEDKIQTAVNANFGEIYSAGIGSEMPEWEELLKHRTAHPPGSLHRGMIRVVMGVDVQKRGLYYTIRGFGSRGTSWLVEHGYLIGETALDDVWDQLATIIMSPIDGIHIERAFIDAGYRPDKPGAGSVHRVYDFCRIHSPVAVPCKTKSNTGGRPFTISKIEVKPDGKNRPFSIGLAMLDPDHFKSLVHTRVKTPLGAMGAFYLHADADEDYARQVLSEVRIVHPGKPKPEWKPIRADNHFFDCECLAAAAGYILNVQKIPPGIQRTFGEDDLELPVANTPEEEKAPENEAAAEEEQAAPEDSKQAALDRIRKRFTGIGATQRR